MGASDGPNAPEGGGDRPGRVRASVDEDDVDEPLDMGDLYDELQALSEVVDDPEERERVEAAMRTAAAVEPSPLFGRVIRGFGRGEIGRASCRERV